MSMLSLIALLFSACTAAEIGQPVTERDVAAWNIDVSPGNGGLPPGRGTVAEGRKIYEEACAACHGSAGDDGPAPKLRGARPLLTIGSYWPYAETLFDYVRRAMPFDRPGSLKDDQVYALTAYLLRINGIVAEETELDAQRLPHIEMPNRGGFRFDPRAADQL